MTGRNSSNALKVVNEKYSEYKNRKERAEREETDNEITRREKLGSLMC